MRKPKKCLSRDEVRQQFMTKRFPKEPKNSGYADEWKGRFDRGSPEKYMDSDSLKIYRKLEKRMCK